MYDLDLGRLWIREGDFTELIRKYMGRESTVGFIAAARAILLSGKAGSTAMVFNKKPVVASQRKGLYGNCMLAVTFRTDGRRPELVMSSRATYFGWTGLLDCCIMHVLAREIAGNPEEVSFAWQVQVGKFHNFNTLLYLWGCVEADDWGSGSPGWDMAQRENARIELQYLKHGPAMAERRIEPYTGRLRLNRKWLTQYHGLNIVKHPGPLWPSTLTFDKL